jgi:hypothetical protein
MHESGGGRMMEQEETTALPMFINPGHKFQADAVATPPARTHSSPAFEASWRPTGAGFCGQRRRRRSQDAAAMKLQRNESCKVVPPGATLLSSVSSVTKIVQGRPKLRDLAQHFD